MAMAAVLVALVLSLPLLSGCGTGEVTSSAAVSESPDSPGPSQKVIFHAAGGDRVLSVEVADSYEERALGLMGRTSLEDDSGMIFIWPSPVREGFWMKDTFIPLSIAFVSGDGNIIDIQDMEPRTLTSHIPPQPYIWAIEANQGYFRQNGIVAGDHVEYTGNG